MGASSSRRRLALPLCLLALAPAAARANGFALDIQGLFSNGTASAGAAAARDPSAQYANPAALASLPGSQVVAGGMLIAARAPYADGGSTLTLGADTVPLGGQDRDGAGTGLAPWAFASLQLPAGVTVGFAVDAPFGTATDYGRDARFFGRYQGVDSRIESVAFGPALAFRPLPSLAIGLSVAARRDRAVLGQVIDLGAACVASAAAQGDPDPLGTCAGSGLSPAGPSDSYARFSATGWGWTLAAGATLDLGPATTLGLAYRYEARSRVTGHQEFDAAAQQVLGVAARPAARLELPLPGFVTASLARKVGSALELHAAFQYSLWSRFDVLHLVPDAPGTGLDLGVKQGYRNAWRASAGAAWSPAPWLDLFGGLAFEQSPITDRFRSATLPERDSLLAGLGAEAQLGGGFRLGAVYQRVQMLGTSRIDQTDAGSGTRVVGTVKGSANLAALQLGWRG